VEQLEKARDAVIEAAKIWYNGRRSVDGIGVDSELFYAVRSLLKLEQPSDPVREFFEVARRARHNPFVHADEYDDKLAAAEKALGMERK
jgi:hypothetical protein